MDEQPDKDLLTNTQAEIEEDECEGHESLRGDSMGLTVYCPNDECVKVNRQGRRYDPEDS